MSAGVDDRRADISRTVVFRIELTYVVRFPLTVAIISGVRRIVGRTLTAVVAEGFRDHRRHLTLLCLSESISRSRRIRRRHSRSRYFLGDAGRTGRCWRSARRCLVVVLG